MVERPHDGSESHLVETRVLDVVGCRVFLALNLDGDVHSNGSRHSRLVSSFLWKYRRRVLLVSNTVDRASTQTTTHGLYVEEDTRNAEGLQRLTTWMVTGLKESHHRLDLLVNLVEHCFGTQGNTT